ncbi:hypothetical protein OROMI_026016 [Orobanche minor]
MISSMSVISGKRWTIRTGFSQALGMLLHSALIDLPLEGYQFTWSRSKGKPNVVEQRLDRGMMNAAWSAMFPEALLVNGSTHISDHNSLILHTNISSMQNKRKRFRFENKWFHEKELPNIVRNCWTNLEGVNILERLTATSKSLMVWSKVLNEETRREKERCEKVIQNLEKFTDAASVMRWNEAKRTLGSILIKEELYWKQRAK